MGKATFRQKKKLSSVPISDTNLQATVENIYFVKRKAVDKYTLHCFSAHISGWLLVHFFW